ncbi:MAG: hypothetical protein WC619_01530 [Patescibacteria group bacterium]
MQNIRLNKKIILVAIIFAFGLTIAGPNKVEAAFGLDPSFKQVKTADSTAVYYLDHGRGFKKAYVNAKAFLAYGNKWEDVKIVSQADLDKWLEMQLVKEKDNPAVYYIKNGKKVLIESTRDFANLGFKLEDIVNLDKTDLEQYASSTYEDVKLIVYKLVDYELVKTKASSAVYYIKNKLKTPIKSAGDFIKLGFKWDDINLVEEDDLNDLAAGSYGEVGLDAGLTSATSSLAVSLGSDSPKSGGSLPLSSTNNLLAIFDLKSEAGQLEVSRLDFTLKGVFSEEVLANIYLSYENKVDLGVVPAINKKIVSFNFGDKPIIISPAETKKIYFWVDLNSCLDCANHNLQIAISQASDISSSGVISGNFPVTSSSLNLVNASRVLGQVKIEELTVGGANQQAIIGEPEQILGKFKISEVSGNEDILVDSLTVRLQGSALSRYFFSLALEDGKGKIVAQANSIGEDGQVLFSLANYKIKKSSEEIFTVSASLNEGDGRNLNLAVAKASIVGSANNFGLKVSYLNIEENIGIVRKNLGVVAKKLEANKKVFTEKTGTIIGVFEIRNGNQKIYLDSFDLSLVKSSGAASLDKEIYMVDYDTGEILGQASGQALASGRVNINIPDKVLEPKKSLTLAFITTMPIKLQDGYTYQLVLNKVNHRTENNIFLANAIDVNGEIFKVILSKVSIYPNDSLTGKIYAKGQTKVVVASFYLESSAGDDTAITGLSINKGSAGAGLTYDNGFSNLKVYLGSKRITTIAQPDKSAYSFEDFSYKLPAGKRIEVKVYVDTIKDLKIDKADLQITGLTARGYSSGIDTEVSGLNVASPAVSFIEAKTRVEATAAGRIIINKKDNIAASFKITNNGGEALKLDYLTINSSGSGFSNGAGYSNLRVGKASDGKSISGKISKPVTGSNRIKLNSYVLEPSQELLVNIYVDTSATVSAGNFSVYLSNLEASGKTSKVAASISGLPTAELNITVVAN